MLALSGFRFRPYRRFDHQRYCVVAALRRSGSALDLASMNPAPRQCAGSLRMEIRLRNYGFGRSHRPHDVAASPD